MTKELQDAIRHIKTRADAWAVKEIINALEQDCDKDCENCDRCVDDMCPNDGMPRIINPSVNEPCDDAIKEGIEAARESGKAQRRLFEEFLEEECKQCEYKRNERKEKK